MGQVAAEPARSVVSGGESGCVGYRETSDNSSDGGGGADLASTVVYGPGDTKAAARVTGRARAIHIAGWKVDDRVCSDDCAATQGLLL